MNRFLWTTGWFVSMALGAVSLLAQETSPSESRGESATRNEQAESTAPHSELSPPQINLQVERLSRQLESKSEAERNAAESELSKLGPEALGHLPAITSEMSEELRARLSRVRDRLEQTASQSLMVGSRVTLTGPMPLSDALASLEKQTSNRLVDFRDEFDQPQLDPQLKLSLKDVPYWRALDVIMDQAGLQLYAYTNESNTLGYVARPDGWTPAARAAAIELFRLEVVRLQAFRDFKDAQNEGLVIGVEVTWEPKVAPLSVHQLPDDLVVTDDHDEQLTVDSTRGILAAEVQEGISTIELEFPLSLPQRQSQVISTLRGKLNVVVPGRKVDLEFDNLMNVKESVKQAGRLNVVLLRPRKNHGLYELRLLLRFENVTQELRSQHGWVFGNEAHLVDADGKVIEYAGLEAFRESLDEIGISYKFDIPDTLEGYRLVYRTPSSVINVPVEYEISDIKLP